MEPNNLAFNKLTYIQCYSGYFNFFAFENRESQKTRKWFQNFLKLQIQNSFPNGY